MARYCSKCYEVWQPIKTRCKCKAGWLGNGYKPFLTWLGPLLVNELMNNG